MSKTGVKILRVKGIDKCPTNHKKAYKTSFGAIYCPDCKKNVKGNKNEL